MAPLRPLPACATGPARWPRRQLALLVALLLACSPCATAQEFSEYRVKAAFLYNFALFTEWPA